MIHNEKIAELEERFQRDLQTGHKDIGLTYANDTESQFLRTAWVMVPSDIENKFFIFEQFEIPGDNKPGYRFGYYTCNDGEVWRRPQANPMFSADEWNRLLAALVQSGMLNGRVVAIFR